MLQFSVQSETSFLAIVGQKRSEGENFAESRTGSHNVTEEREIEKLQLISH